MTHKIYIVWTEDEDGNENAILFEGSKAAAYRYFNTHGKSKSGLHVGYRI
jgi:hypothetical protein